MKLLLDTHTLLWHANGEPHVRAFDITGRPMKHWVAVGPEGVEDDDQLSAWVERAIKFVKTLPKK